MISGAKSAMKCFPNAVALLSLILVCTAYLISTQNPEKVYLEKSRLRFANDHFLAFDQGYDSRSSLSSGSSDSGISFAMI
jgi:hypothetical protein